MKNKKTILKMILGFFLLTSIFWGWGLSFIIISSLTSWIAGESNSAIGYMIIFNGTIGAIIITIPLITIGAIIFFRNLHKLFKKQYA